MKYIVYKEKRPFSYLDFIDFTVNGQNHHITRNTFRNKLCYIFKDEVEVVCYSPIAFYTLKGHNFSNSITQNHTEDKYNITQNNSSSLSSSIDGNTYLCNLPIYRYIKNLPFGKRSIHDIRLRFTINGLWKTLANNSKFQVLKSSKDILIAKFERENLNIRITVHDTDTVSVIVGCSFVPIELDIHGLIRLSNVLAIAEDKIFSAIEQCDGIRIGENDSSMHIQHYTSWIISMWHFGRDAAITYEKEKFCIEYRTAQEIIYRIYDKEWKHNGKRLIRIEKQEYPNKNFAEAMEEQLNK
jgi:hypothetical protein